MCYFSTLQNENGGVEVRGGYCMVLNTLMGTSLISNLYLILIMQIFNYFECKKLYLSYSLKTTDLT